MRIHLHLQGKFDRKFVHVLKEALEPEIRQLPKIRYRGNIAVEGETLHLWIEASDLTALRASLNSYLRYISVCSSSVKALKEG
jgi:KEOPS complex subunit Pcc1